MLILDILSLSVGGLFGLFGLYYAIIAVLGMRRPARSHPRAKPVKRIAAVIAARNEEELIADSVGSLLRQDYPRALMGVYVVPNNCTDDTAGAALRAGASVIEPDKGVHDKGGALRSAFARLISTDEYDAFCVFDADNIVDSAFFTHVNDALCAGELVCQGYRDSKNPRASWISAGMSLFYWFMNRMFNRARSQLGMSANLNGTGFMVSAELLKSTGFDTVALTEDIEYSAQLALRGVKIGWMNDAVTYDEQPTSLFISMRQRRRWFGGSMQCLKRYFLPLLRVKTSQSRDMAMLFFGVVTQIAGLVPACLSVVSAAIKLKNEPGIIASMLTILAISLIVILAGIWAFAIYISRAEKRECSAWGIALFPVFLLTWMIANLSCIFTGIPGWKPIRHGEAAYARGRRGRI